MSEDLIIMELQGNSKDEVMDELVDKIDATGVIKKKKKFRKALDGREKESSTGIGYGIAIPHGKSKAVEAPRVAFGLKKEGVDWQSIDGTKANLIFMIAVPEKAAGDTHLKILQMLSRKLMDEDFREALIHAENKDEVITLLKEIA